MCSFEYECENEYDYELEREIEEELHEKMNLDVARFDKGAFVDRHDEPIPVDPKANPWSAFPIVLASSHLARPHRYSLLVASLLVAPCYSSWIFGQRPPQRDHIPSAGGIQRKECP